jgi:hypothetical protein
MYKVKKQAAIKFIHTVKLNKEAVHQLDLQRWPMLLGFRRQLFCQAFHIKMSGTPPGIIRPGYTKKDNTRRR